MTPASLDRFKVVILANSTCLSDAQAKMLSRLRRSWRQRRRGVRDRDADRRQQAARRHGPRQAARRHAAGAHPRCRQEHLCRAQRQASGQRRLRRRRAHHRRHAPDRGRCRRRAPSSRSSTSRISPTCRWRRSIRAKPRVAPRWSPASTRAADARSISPGTSARSSGRCWPRTTSGSSPTRSAGPSASGRTSRSRAAVSSISPCATSDDGVAVVLNNLTNPMAMKGPIREVFPVGRHTVSVAIPKGRSLGNGAAARFGPQGQGDGVKRPRRDRGAAHRYDRGRAPHLGVGRTVARHAALRHQAADLHDPDTDRDVDHRVPHHPAAAGRLPELDARLDGRRRRQHQRATDRALPRDLRPR